MPSVVMWYVVYCVAMAVMGLLAAGMGGLILFGPQEMQESMRQQMMDSGQAADPVVYGMVYLIAGAVSCLLHLLGAVAPKRPWAWIYGIVLIALGMTTCCCLPATIPLLIFWIKPATQQYYGRQV